MPDRPRPELSTEQARWLAGQLVFGVDYLQFGSEREPQFLFFLTDEEWAEWLPKIPAAQAGAAKPFLTYREFEDGWTFEIGADGKPIPGKFRFTNFCMGATCSPAVTYDSGGFSGTRALAPEGEESTRAKLLGLGFVETTAAPPEQPG